MRRDSLDVLLREFGRQQRALGDFLAHKIYGVDFSMTEHEEAIQVYKILKMAPGQTALLRRGEKNSRGEMEDYAIKVAEVLKDKVGEYFIEVKQFYQNPWLERWGVVITRV